MVEISIAPALPPAQEFAQLPGMEEFDVVIVGVGAAELMCAMTAGQPGRRVLLDHADEVGKKILISGSRNLL